MNDYGSQARKLDEKYRRKYAGLATSSWLSVGAFLIPHLATLIAAVPGLTLAGKYAHEKLEELSERKELAQSLVGILATAQDDPSNEE
ncbi:MAG: hypothetical protein WDM87_06760 [Terracidiphilus sp.]